MTNTDGPSEQYATSSVDLGVEIARRQGFCLLKRFFDPGETAAWELAATALSGEDRKRDFMSHGHLDALLFDERVLALARRLMGSRVAYYGETSCAVDGAEPFREWHMDARGMPEDIEAFHEPTPGEVYGGWRFAIYFRDYRTSSGGLKVAPGSHLWPVAQSYTKERHPSKIRFCNGDFKVHDFPFKTHNVPSQPGDLVIFNLRTCHSAGFVRLKEHPYVSLPPDFESRVLRELPQSCVVSPPGTRRALFFDYTSPTAGPDMYVKWRARHTVSEDATDVPLYAYDRPDIRSKAAAHGVLLRYDRIIAQLLYKDQTVGLESDEQLRLQSLFELNEEFSPYHSLRAFR